VLPPATSLLQQNAAIDATNRGLVEASTAVATQVAWLRHLACQVLHASQPQLLQESQRTALLGFCLRVGG
jgi:hypothetical protein